MLLKPSLMYTVVVAKEEQILDASIKIKFSYKKGNFI